VTVNSQGSIKVTPDAVRLNANVSFVAGSNKEALAKVSTVSAAVRAALTKSGILKARYRDPEHFLFIQNITTPKIKVLF
jgi:uncharacterized protein